MSQYIIGYVLNVKLNLTLLLKYLFVLFFPRFPGDSYLRSKWIASIGRQNWTPGRRSMICSAHFEKTQFKTKGHFQLIEGAVPTIFQSLRKKKVCAKKNDLFNVCLHIVF